MLPTIPPKYLEKLCRFARLKLYPNLDLFQLTKGTPHTGPTPPNSSTPSPY